MLVPAFNVGWPQIFNRQNNLMPACVYILRDVCQA